MKKLEISQLTQVEGGKSCAAAMAGCGAGALGLGVFGPAVVTVFFIGCSMMGCSN